MSSHLPNQVAPHSTPRKAKSSHHSTPQSPFSGSVVCKERHQSQLIRALNTELNKHVWEHSADSIAKMLSPKKFEDDRTGIYLIDEPAVKTKLMDEDMSTSSVPFERWDTAVVEKDFYAPIIKFLNYCVEKCDTIYDSLCTPESLNKFKLRERGSQVL